MNMNNYHNGKIYRIISPSADGMYIGSTIRPLNQRLQDHKLHYKRYLNGKYHYVTSFELVKYDDCKIELICDYHCNSKKELCEKEGEIQREMDCINKNIAGRTKKEWCDENRDEMLKQRKKHYEDNKDEILKYQKKHYEDNKDEISKRRSVKITCECGAIIRNDGKLQHYKTNKHIKFVESSSFS
jgi:vacuolar-type H+-ATPase subunit H